MQFSEAIEGGFLTDYKVVILTLKSTRVEVELANLMGRVQESGLALDDAVKLLGCWDALADPEGFLSDRDVTGDQHKPVAAGHYLHEHDPEVAIGRDPLAGRGRRRAPANTRGIDPADLLPLAVAHVDGKQNALDRQRKLAWLQEKRTPTARRSAACLTNARCLTEGVDVPALDAVVFLAPRKSQVDVVQAVGRVMRRAAGKRMGYIILPVVAGPDQDPEQVLNDDKTFQVVWSVLRALRFPRRPASTWRIQFPGPEPQVVGADSSLSAATGTAPTTATATGRTSGSSRPLDLVYKIPQGAKSSPRWWRSAATASTGRSGREDVADIADRIRLRVTGLLANPERITLKREFRAVPSTTSGKTLHRELDADDVVSMIAQHLVTGPVFPGPVCRLRLRGPQFPSRVRWTAWSNCWKARAWRTRPGI